MEEAKFFDTFFLMGLPEKEEVEAWIELTCAETEAQEEFLNRVEEALKEIDYDYYIATMEPSFQKGKIVYSKGAPVATGLTGRQWVAKAKEYFCSTSWRSDLAILEEGDLFKAYRVAMGYWSLEYVCDTSSEDVRAHMLSAGEVEIGGFCDGIGNSFELYRDKGGISLVGGCYLNFGNINPVMKALRFYPDAKSEHGRGVLVIRKQ